MRFFDLAMFKRQLAETIAWCTQPNVQVNGEYTFRKVNFMATADDWLRCILDEERQPCIQSMIEERAKLLHNNNIPITPLDSTLAGGRLLLFFPDQTLRDGVAWVESEEFFDHINDFPPPDTWVFYGLKIWHLDDRKKFPNYLLCWVPQQCLSAIDSAIKWNTANHIMWLADMESSVPPCPFADTIQQEGLLR